MSLKNKLIITIGVVLIILVNLLTVLHIVYYKISEQDAVQETYCEAEDLAYCKPDTVKLYVIEQTKELTVENEHFSRVLYHSEKMLEAVQYYTIVETDELDTKAETIIELCFDGNKTVILPLEADELTVRPNSVKIFMSGDDRGKFVVEDENKRYVLEKVECSSDFYKYVCELVLGAPSTDGYWG